MKEVIVLCKIGNPGTSIEHVASPKRRHECTRVVDNKSNQLDKNMGVSNYEENVRW